MSRRLAIPLSVVAVVIAVLLLRGLGTSPAPDSEAPKAGARAERRPGAAGSRDGGAPAEPAGDAAGAARHRQMPSGERLSGAKLQAAPFPSLGREPVGEPADPENIADLRKLIHTATEDPDPNERAAAISDLSLRDDFANILPVFYQVAKDPDPDVKLAVVTALGELGEAAPIDLVAQYASDRDPEIRLEALSVVESLAEEESTANAVAPILNRATHDPDEEVREKANEIVEQLSGESDAEDE